MLATNGTLLRTALRDLDLALDQEHPPRWSGTTADGRRVIVELGTPLLAVATVSVEHGHEVLFAVPRALAPSHNDAFKSGDGDFDTSVLVVGGDAVAGLLGHDVRVVLRHLIEQDCVVSGGWARLAINLETSADPSESRVENLLWLAETLASIHDIPRAALEIAASDPIASVRERYQELARTPELRAIAVADELARHPSDERGLALAVRHLEDDALEPATRGIVAAWALTRFTPGRLAEVPRRAWRQLTEVPRAIDALAERVRRVADVEDARGLMRLIESFVDGALDRLPPALARTALDALDLLFEPTDRAWLARLVAHGDVEVAAKAGAELLQTYTVDDLARLTMPSEQRRSRHATDLLVDRLCQELERRGDGETRMRCLEIVARVLAHVDGAPELPWAKTATPERLQRLVSALERGRESALLPLLAPIADAEHDTIRRQVVDMLLGLPVDRAALAAALSPAAMGDLVTVAPRRADAFLHNAGARLVELYPGSAAPDGEKIRYIEALGRVGNTEATPLLLAALKDSHQVRLAGLEALAQVGGPAAIPPLRALSFHLSDVTARRLAIRAYEAVVARHGEGRGGLAISDEAPDGGLALHDDGHDPVP